MRTKQELYQAALRTVALRRQTARANKRPIALHRRLTALDLLDRTETGVLRQRLPGARRRAPRAGELDAPQEPAAQLGSVDDGAQRTKPRLAMFLRERLGACDLSF